MSAINFVVRDVAGNITRGSVAGEDTPSSLIVGSGADISLNLSRGQITSYTRQGQALEVTLIDGRVIVIEGFFTMEGVTENQLFLSADGFLTEVELNQGAGADYFANYVEGDGMGKFAVNDDLYFMRGADIMLADSFVPADDQVGMLAAALGGFAPLVGLGGAGLATAAVIGTQLGGGSSGPTGPNVTITNGTEGSEHVVNEEDHSDGVEIGGTGDAGATVDVTIGGVTETTTVGEDGTWGVTFGPADIPTGEYETDVEVTITNEDGETNTVTDTLIVDTEVDVTIDAAGGADGVINSAEYDNGVTLGGQVVGGSNVTVTIDGEDYVAVVTGTTWTLDLTDILPTGEYQSEVVVTATDTAGNSTSTSTTIVVDTITSVTMDTTTIGGADGVINGVERDAGVTINGTAQSGSSVLVTFGGATMTVVAGANGTWSATYPASDIPTGETTVNVTAVATDAAGNTASASGTVQVDTFVNELEITSAPIGGDGVVNFDESGQAITMTGTVEAGSTVSVTLHGVTTAATVDANGDWTVTYPAGTLPAGEYETSVTVTATDAAGNTSSLSEAVTVDTVAGDLALSTQPIEIDDVINGVEASDGVTINGTATAGLTVTVGLGDATMDVVAGPNGTWSANFPAGQIPAGTYDAPITASITDAAGNYKEVSDTVRVDTQVDNFGFTAGPIEGDDFINGEEASDGVVLSGTVEPGSSVLVEFAGSSMTVTAGQDGLWSATFPAAAIEGGEYTSTITATATDRAGNVAVITDSVQIDTLVNNLTSNDPVEGDNIVSSAEAADGITLGGTVEAGSTVLVTFEGISRMATVDGSGNWTVSYGASEIPQGEYTANVTIAATDAYGNTDSITDTFYVDTVAPDAPDVESVTITQEGVEFIGIDTTSNSVTVSEIGGNGSVIERASDEDGVLLPWGSTLFNFDPALSDGSQLVVTETDDAGNSNSTYLVLEETGSNRVGLDGLSDFEIGAIDLSFAKDSELTLDLSTLQGLADADNNLVIHGGADDAVTLSGASNSGLTETIDGKSYDVYTMGDDATVYIEEFVNVTT